MNVIVTGAAGNMGRAVTEKLLGAGHNVIGTLAPGEVFEPDHPGLEKQVIDLLDEQETRDWFEDVLASKKKIGAAVLTVGGFAMGAINETDDAALEKMIRLNFYSAFHCVRPLFAHMQQTGGGRIFLVSSGPGMHAHKSAGMLAYGLSKSMVARLAEMVRQEGKEKSVHATTIVPSTIDTPQNRAAMPGADWSKWVKPEKIAEDVLANLGKEGKDYLDYCDFQLT
jgi:NAD(P)-dependent dehydrogenase (short-subunit alcohol dehydrogenase family)